MKQLGSHFVIQCKLCAIYGFNGLYNLLPFFCLKNILLGLAGIKVGRGTVIHTPVRFFGVGRIRIGCNTVVNRGCYLDNRVGIEIGSNVSIAHDTKVYSLGHDIDDPYFSPKGAKVEIADYACIFSNVLIMPNVRLGKGAVVYAGSVVTKDVGDYEIVGGNPARLIRHRSRDLRYTLNHDYWFVS